MICDCGFFFWCSSTCMQICVYVFIHWFGQHCVLWACYWLKGNKMIVYISMVMMRRKSRTLGVEEILSELKGWMNKKRNGHDWSKPTQFRGQIGEFMNIYMYVEWMNNTCAYVEAYEWRCFKKSKIKIPYLILQNGLPTRIISGNYWHIEKFWKF